MPISRPAELEFERDLALRKLFHISHDGILVFGDRGRKLLDANLQVVKTLGYSRAELRALSVDRIFADQKAIQRFFDSLWSEPVRTTKRKSLEQIACRHKSGRIVGASLSASMILHCGQPAALVVIGERLRRRYTNDFLRNQAKLSGLLHTVTGTTIGIRNLQHDVRDWLRRICRQAQLPVGHVRILAGDFVGSPGEIDVWHIKPAHQFKSVRENPSRIAFPEDFRNRVTSTRMPEIVPDIERDPHFAVSEFHNLNLRSAVAIPVTVEQRVSAISEFFSPRLLEEDPLLVDVLECLGRELGYVLWHHAISVKAMREQDEERRRLARDLHDTTAQGLAMMILELGRVEKESDALTIEARTAVVQSIELARRSLAEVRTFSYLLHPPMLDEMGLLSAVQIFAEGFSRRSDIRIETELPDSLPRMPPDWEMALFRTVQEGLTNVRRHSHSRTAAIRLRIGGGIANLVVENEGASVPPLSMGGLPPEHVGVGIAGMRERLRVFGGDAVLYSRENLTVLEVTVPLPRPLSSAVELNAV
ncbi:MAG TPA: sensor histidine kinase [Candidatus Acidoferrum sp.]|nr:sensor histidine kinase [Candidatus Acidoferrum sp.]